MTIIVFILVNSAFISCKKESNIAQSSAKKDTLNVYPGWEIVWHDEFNDNGAPDSTKWTYDLGGGGWGNNEKQFYTSDSINVRVENGKLVIESQYYPDNSEIPYTSTRIKTKNHGDWLYGRIEIRAKIPAGRGTWPAIWMLPTDWQYGGWPISGEIDIMEHVGFEPNIIYGTVHTEAYNHIKGTQRGGKKEITTTSEKFHLFAIEWDSEKIDFYIDEQKYFTFNNEHKTYAEWPFDRRFHIIINTAIGGDWGGTQGIDNSIFPVKFFIDYVRVYKRN